MYGLSVTYRRMRYGWMTMMMMLMGIGSAVAGPHEHGVVYLDIAIEGQSVSLSVRGAGDGFVGFERSPRTDEERRLVEAASARLQQGDRQFIFDAAAGCQQTAADIEVPQRDKAKHTHHHHGSGDAHHHEHHDHHDEAHHHDHHGEAHQVHKDWSAQWAFRCERPGALRSLQVNLFDDFPGIHEARVQLISETLQTSARLTPASRRLTLTPAP